MKDLTLRYSWEDGRSGEFVRKDFPELVDFAKMCLSAEDYEHPEQYGAAVEALADSRAFQSLVWGNLRQLFVTWRAKAKRLVEGNKTNAPRTYAQVAEMMANEVIPQYDEPEETKTAVEKVMSGLDRLSETAYAQFLVAQGVEEGVAKMLAAQREQKRKDS